MEWSTVIHRRVQIVRLIVPHHHVAQPAQSREHRVGQTAVEMAGQSDLPGSWAAGERSRHGMNGYRDRWYASRLSFQKNRFDRFVIRAEPSLNAGRSGCLVKMEVAGDNRPVAYFRYQV